MKRVVAAVCCVALCSIPVLAKEKASEVKAMTDQQFVDFAAQTDMVEANLGKLAQDVANSADVKDYGKMLATDHTDDYKQLTEAAEKDSMTVPNAIDAEHIKAEIAPFHELRGAGFDGKFVPAMVAGHTKVIAVYKAEADNAQSAVLRSYAQGALVVLEKHLEKAKGLEKSKGKK